MFGNSKLISVTLQRPDNITPYSAGQVITADGTAIVFPEVGAVMAGASGYIVQATVASDDAVPVGLKLLIFRAAPENSLVDGGNLDLVFNDLKNLLAVIDLDTEVLANNDMSVRQNSDFRVLFKAPAGTGVVNYSALYGLLVADGGFTPAAEQSFHVTLGLEMN